MSLVARVLPPEEWAKVTTPELAPSLRYVSSAGQADIVVVESEREIIASLTVMGITHFENAWIAEAWRKNPGVVRRLLRAANDVAVARGDRWAMWGAADNDPDMRALVAARGEMIPVRFWAVPVGTGG